MNGGLYIHLNIYLKCSVENKLDFVKALAHEECDRHRSVMPAPGHVRVIWACGQVGAEKCEAGHSSNAVIVTIIVNQSASYVPGRVLSYLLAC